MSIGLQSVTYTVERENIESGQRFSWRRGARGNITSIDVRPGLYGFDKLQRIIVNEAFGSLTVHKENGLVNLSLANQHEVRMTDGLLNVLGLEDGTENWWLGPGIYIGDRPVNFANRKVLFTHLDQINTTYNTVDSSGSTPLASIGLGCHSHGI